jgi:DNA-directed RNA polymerase subunit omega
MARITVEDGLKKVPNEFELVMLGAKRAQQLIRGAAPLVKSDNCAVVLALREIAAGKVRKTTKELSPLRNPLPQMLTRGGA